MTCVMFGGGGDAEEQFDVQATQNIALFLLPHISLLLPSPPSSHPNYICGVTADGISSLPLWEGTIFLRIFLPLSSSARCSAPNMRTVHRNALLDTVVPKDMIHAKAGGEK